NWRSSNPDVATISSNGEDKGMVTGVSAGTVSITVSGEANGQHFSATAVVEVEAPLAFFTTPDTNTRNWNDADAYCKGLSPAARLPTRAELQNLFIQSTSATAISQPNFEMCDVHGWPLSSRCGGSTKYYWISEAFGISMHWLVNMNTGNAISNRGTYGGHVTCVR
ncbi:TPA: Ig-like domain-containing protein, partial [Aeromonas hydrophila]